MDNEKAVALRVAERKLDGATLTTLFLAATSEDDYADAVIAAYREWQQAL